MPELFSRYGSEDQCVPALKAPRRPQDFRCPRCNGAEHYVVGHGGRSLFQCRGCCRHQASLTAGTLMGSSKLSIGARTTSCWVRRCGATICTIMSADEKRAAWNRLGKHLETILSTDTSTGQDTGKDEPREARTAAAAGQVLASAE